MKTHSLAATLTLGVFLIALPIVQGSEIIKETRPVSNFHRVSLSGSGEVTVVQGPVESLTIEAEASIMDRVKSEVRNGELVLGLDHGFWLRETRPTRKIKYFVTMKEIRGLDIAGSGSVMASSVETDYLELNVSGSGDVVIEYVETNELEINISGSGDCEVAGKTNEQDIQISGSGEYDAPDLESQIATARISGSGEATVQVRDRLDVRISGSGEVTYYGQPDVISNITGSGKVKKKNGGSKNFK